MKTAKDTYEAITSEIIRLEEMSGIVEAITDNLENCKQYSAEVSNEYSRVIEPLLWILKRHLKESADSMNGAVREWETMPS